MSELQRKSKNGILRNTKNSKTSETSWLAQLWVVTKHVLKKSQTFFTEYSEEQDSNRQYFGNSQRFWHSFLSKTPLVTCSYYTEFLEDGDRVVSALNHLNWITFLRPSNNNNELLCVISYINIYLSYMCFTLRKNIFNHKDICCFFFFNNGEIFVMINIYSNDYQSALKYLKDTEVNICNVLIMAGDFNIRDSD